MEDKDLKDFGKATKYSLISMAITLVALAIISTIAVVVYSDTLTASWYDRASCLKESGQHKMANGKELNDGELTAASWDYSFGTMLKVVNLKTRKSVLVKVTDRGPSRRLYSRGRVLDLSRGAFQSIAKLSDGVIPISFEVVK